MQMVVRIKIAKADARASQRPLPKYFKFFSERMRPPRRKKARVMRQIMAKKS